MLNRHQDYNGEQEWYRKHGYRCIGISYASLSGVHIPYQLLTDNKNLRLAATRISAGWYQLIGNVSVMENHR